MPEFFPVNRFRELETLLKATVKNWATEELPHKKVFAPVLSQSNGLGKTFMLNFLHLFLSKTLEDEILPVPFAFAVRRPSARPTATALDAVEQAMKNFVDKDHLDALRKLKSVRPFLVDVSFLLPDCKDLDQAIMVGVAATILEQEEPHAELAKNLEMIGVDSLHGLCDLLIKETGGAVIILDDFVDLIGDLDYSQMLNTESKEPTARHVFHALSKIADILLRKTGVVMAVTGRSPSITYDILKTGRAAPINVTAIMLDALSPVDVANILYNTKAHFGGRHTALRDELGLHEDQDVLEFARVLHFYSGGHPRAIMYVIEGLMEVTDKDKHLLHRGMLCIMTT